jgi:branched-chain amino acid transport system ATP-binding protein
LKARGISVLLIEHNMRVIMSACDRILVMHHGESLMVGSPTEVKNDKRVEAAYLGDVDGLA